MQDPAHIIIIRDPDDARLHAGNQPATWTEQLNGTALMLISSTFHGRASLLGIGLLFCVQDEEARTIRFTSQNAALLNLLAQQAKDMDLEVVLGPVIRPETVQEGYKRSLSHRAWHLLEQDVTDTAKYNEAELQLMHAELGRRELSLTREVRDWDDEKIDTRLLNTQLAVAERRIIEERRAVRHGS
jgi:hypothetical protein